MFARKAGQTKVMTEALETALTLKPDEVYALNVKSRHLMQQGDYAGASKVLKPYLERHHTNRSYMANAERAFRKIGDWATVAQIKTWQVGNLKARRLRPGQRNYKRLRAADGARLNKGRLEGWAAVGDTWVKAKRWDKAVPAYAEAAARAGSGRSDLKRKYAISLAHVKNWKKCMHESRVTIDLARSEADALLDGLETARSTLKTDANKRELDKIMRMIEGRAGDAVSARKARKTLDDDKKIAEYVAKYKSLTAAGKHPEALDWLRKAAGRSKERRGDVKRAYAVGLAQAAQWDKAFHEAEQAIRIDWRQRERLIIAIEKLRKIVDDNARRQLDELIAKVRLL